MKLLSVLVLTSSIVNPAMAEETRQLDAHEHGVGQLNIAFEGKKIAMELHAPGADIVGFEYAAKSAEDRKAVDDAVAMLARPMKLFALPDAAGCNVIQAAAELESEEDHEAHDDDHADNHVEEEHQDEHKPADDDHANKHEDDEHHDEHKHADDDHEDHEDHAQEDAGHTEFHAEYLLTCAKPDAVSEITFAYFETFPNALEVEVQVISGVGATAFEVTRDAPKLDLRGMF